MFWGWVWVGDGIIFLFVVLFLWIFLVDCFGGGFGWVMVVLHFIFL